MERHELECGAVEVGRRVEWVLDGGENGRPRGPAPEFAVEQSEPIGRIRRDDDHHIPACEEVHTSVVRRPIKRSDHQHAPGTADVVGDVNAGLDEIRHVAEEVTGERVDRVDVVAVALAPRVAVGTPPLGPDAGASHVRRVVPEEVGLDGVGGFRLLGRPDRELAVAAPPATDHLRSRMRPWSSDCIVS